MVSRIWMRRNCTSLTEPITSPAKSFFPFTKFTEESRPSIRRTVYPSLYLASSPELSNRL
ncbi:MAG: hypothetical protein LBB67_05275 [Oscillospiraceae bacterium]|nr:hypothetical protein [Oscillospiraceae bacterium]